LGNSGAIGASFVDLHNYSYIRHVSPPKRRRARQCEHQAGWGKFWVGGCYQFRNAIESFSIFRRWLWFFRSCWIGGLSLWLLSVFAIFLTGMLYYKLTPGCGDW